MHAPLKLLESISTHGYVASPRDALYPRYEIHEFAVAMLAGMVQPDPIVYVPALIQTVFPATTAGDTADRLLWAPPMVPTPSDPAPDGVGVRSSTTDDGELNVVIS